MARKYSIDEIDAMRRSVETLCERGGSYLASERTVEVEQRLRTYMANGTEPEELAQAASAHLGRLIERQEFARGHGIAT